MSAYSLEDLPIIDQEEWPDRIVVYRAVPFPFARKPALPSSLHKTAHRQWVPLAKVYASQRRITEHGVEKYLSLDEEPAFEELPMVYAMPDDTYIISDGHHRFTAAYLRGDEKALARVVKVPDSVGAIPSEVQAILDNPTSTALELLALGPEYQDQLIAHPNCPLGIWWAHLPDKVIDCLLSPAAQLFILEDPSRFREAWETRFSRWIMSGLDRLSEQQVQQFVIECSERVLPLWLDFYECHNKKPDVHIQRALQARRDFAEGKTTDKTLSIALGLAKKWLYRTKERRFMHDVTSALAVSAAESACEGSVGWALVSARMAKGYEKQAKTRNGESYGPAMAEEGLWQWSHLYETYLRPLYPTLPSF